MRTTTSSNGLSATCESARARARSSWLARFLVTLPWTTVSWAVFSSAVVVAQAPSPLPCGTMAGRPGANLSPSVSSKPFPERHHPAARSALARAGMAFVANAGQWEQGTLFRARIGSLRCDVHADGWSVTLLGSATCAAPTVRFRVRGGGAAPAPVGEERLPGQRSYFLGDDPARWRTDVPAYASVLLRAVAPGIDVRLREADGRPEYDVLAGPGADLANFVVRLQGATHLEHRANGMLVAHTPAGPLEQPPPVASSGGSPLGCRFDLLGTDRFGFAVHGWDRTGPLVIDPPLLYGTYLGGTGSDVIAAVVARGSDLTVCGSTNGDFPVTANAYQTAFGGGAQGWPDGFVARFDLSRTGAAQLVYSCTAATLVARAPTPSGSSMSTLRAC